MYLTDEDKAQYNLIEDVNNSRIIGRVEDVVNYINDMIDYNLKNTDDAENIEQLKDLVRLIRTNDDDEIIAIYENCMLGLDYQLIK